MVEEARLEESPGGLVPTTEGWFVVNVRDGRWVTNEVLGDAFVVEGDNVPFQVGYTLGVLQPGQAGGRYHHESDQEDFLVLAGECLLLIEGEERPLKAWDFVHCPPGTDHAFVAAGDGPCVIFMTGARSENKEIVYPRSELAIRHGAGVETTTSSPAEAYAPFPKWKDERPKSWVGLPWA
ncbi:MAG: cupin domain-containing protein [Gaiellaceae bacterium]